MSNTAFGIPVVPGTNPYDAFGIPVRVAASGIAYNAFGIPAIVAGANTLAAPLGQLTLAGLIPTFAQTANRQLAAPLGTLTLSGLIPSFVQTGSQVLVAPLGQLTLSGFAASFDQSGPQAIVAPLGTLTLVGLPPAFTQSTPSPAQSGGGGGASGGGKRHLPNLDELDTFRRIEKRRPGQSILDALRTPESPTPVAEAKPLAVKTEDSLAVVERRLGTKIDSIAAKMEARVAAPVASQPPAIPDTEDDDAEILSIISLLM